MKKRFLSIILILTFSIIICTGSVFAATAEQAGYESPCDIADGIFDPESISFDSILAVGDFGIPVPIGWDASMVIIDDTEYGIMTSPNGYEVHLSITGNDNPDKFRLELYCYQSHTKCYGQPNPVDKIVAAIYIKQLALVDCD